MEISCEEILRNSAFKVFSQFEITNAKMEGLDLLEKYNVYVTVNNIDHKFITLRWVLNEKYLNSDLNVKARLVAKRNQQDPPTSDKENMHLVLILSPP